MDLWEMMSQATKKLYLFLCNHNMIIKDTGSKNNTIQSTYVFRYVHLGNHPHPLNSFTRWLCYAKNCNT